MSRLLKWVKPIFPSSTKEERLVSKSFSYDFIWWWNYPKCRCRLQRKGLVRISGEFPIIFTSFCLTLCGHVTAWRMRIIVVFEKGVEFIWNVNSKAVSCNHWLHNYSHTFDFLTHTFFKVIKSSTSRGWVFLIYYNFKIQLKSSFLAALHYSFNCFF